MDTMGGGSSEEEYGGEGFGDLQDEDKLSVDLEDVNSGSDNS
jgi:hypothetical protein